MPSVIVAIGSIVISTVGAAVSTSLGLALASAGAMAVGAATVIGGLMLANKAISSLYEMPKVDTDASRQRTVKGTIEPQKILYGENLVSGPISFVGTYGDTNRVLAHAVVLASHEVEEITNIYFDEEIITDSQIDVNGYVTSGKFGPVGNKTFNFNGTNFGTNICKINRYTGASGQTADADLVANFFSYTSNHIGTGLAYVTTHWLLKDGSQKTWDQYAPRDIKAIVKGRKVYDPRTDTTAYSDNPALCLADYLTNTDFGMSIASTKIDWDSVSDAADACDVTVSVPSATEKRFTCNGVLFGTDSHKTNINKILSSMNGLMSFTNGKFVIRAGVYEAPAVSLNEDHLAGAVSVKTSFERSDRFNTVTGTFIDPAQNYKATEFPEVQITAALLRDNSEVLTKDVQLPMTNSSYMAQRIAHKLVQISDQQKVVTFPTNLAGMQIAIGDRVSVSLEEFNWTNKVFICLGWTFSDSGNGGVSLILREDDAGSYADPLVGEYSTISATGGIITGFRGYPDPQNLSATAGLKSVELNWDNPDNMKDIEEIEVFASPNSSWASAVKIGAVKGTQFKHDESNTVDSVAVGDQRWYWVRARGYSFGDTEDAVSDRNPDNDTSTISATVGVIPWADVDGDGKPEDNATVGATVGVDLVDDDGTTVLTHDDIINAVLRIDLTAVQIETGEVLDLETGQDVLIQNLGDVAIYVNESNQIINASISSVRDTVTGLEATLVDLVSGVSDVYVQAAPPVAGVGGIPDPIPTFSRWYDLDDSNAPYYWNDTEWVSLADPRIASNASAITTLQSGLNTANASISANSSAINVLDATTIIQGESIVSISGDVSTLQSELNIAEGDITANAEAVSELTTRVEDNEDSIISQSLDISELKSTVNDPTTGVTASAEAISGLKTRVEQTETDIVANSEDISALETTVNDETTGVAATASALSGLTTRVGLAEDTIDAHTSDITALEVTVNDETTGVSANASAISSLDSRVTVNEGSISSTASDTTALQVSFTDLTKVQDEADAVITTEDGTDLILNLPTDVAQAASAANTLLDARVTTAEGTIVSQSTQITQLQSDLTTLDGEQEGTASALESLTTRVTDTEGTLSVESSKIIQLQADLDDLALDQSGTADALSVLSADVSLIDDDVQANAQSILDLRTDVDGNQASITQINNVSSDSTSAIAVAVASLQVDVGDNIAAITSINNVASDSDSAIAQSVFNLNATVQDNVSDIADAIDSIATAQATADGKVTTFYQDEAPTAEGNGDLWVDTNDSNKLYRWDSNLEIPAWVEIRDAGIAQAIQDASDAQETADGKIVSYFQDDAPISASEGDLWFDTNDGNKAYRWDSTLETPAWVTIQDDLIAQATADIEQINTVSVDSESAIAQSVATLIADVGDNSASITAINNVSATSDSAIAVAVNSLNVTVGDNQTTLNEVKEVTDGVSAQYTVTIDNNDHISGFGLVSDIIAGNPTSAFIVNADQFAIGGAGVITDEYPFVVYTTEQTVSKNGTNYTIPVGVYIKDAFIQNAAIESAQIQNAAIISAKIADLAVDTIKIADQAVTIPSSTELASSYTWGGTTELQSIMTHTFTGTGATAEVLSVITAGGAGSPNLTLYWYHNGVFKRQQAYVYGGVMVFPITTTSGSNTIELKASLSSTVGTCIIPTAYIRTLETKK